MSINTETPSGKAWVEKYLHPPSVPRATYAGIPDMNMSPVTSLQFETVNNIPTVFVIDGVIRQATEIFFLQTTGALVVAYVFVRSPDYNNNGWVQHPQYPAIVNDSYNFHDNWGADVSMQRLAYKSCTYFLNATAFNDQGTVTIAQARPQFFVFSSPLIPPAADTDYDFPKQPSRRVGGEFDYNAQILEMGDISGPGFIGDYVPSTPTQIQQSSPKAVTHMAREGAFVTQHWSQPTNRFWNNPGLENGSDADLVQTWIRFTQSDHSEHTVRLYSKMNSAGHSPEPNLGNAADTVWTDFTIAYVYFSGLSVSSGPAGLSNAYITVKSAYCVEVQPHAKSSFVFFQNSAPVPDDRAIHIAAAVTHQVPDGFPASANGFASILGLVANYAPKVITWLGNAFKSNAPAEKAVEKVAERVIEKKVRAKPAPQKRPAVVLNNNARQAPRRPKVSVNMNQRIAQLEQQLQRSRIADPTRRYRNNFNTGMRPMPQRRQSMRYNNGMSNLPTPIPPIVNLNQKRFSNRL
jgi:hypothetical protein